MISFLCCGLFNMLVPVLNTIFIYIVFLFLKNIFDNLK